MPSDHFLIDGPQDAGITFILAHGAGAPMDTPFMNLFAAGVAGEGIRVVRFEFPYMRTRRLEGKRRGPDRAAVLERTWLDVIAQFPDVPKLVIGGKSMGGRYASMVAARSGVNGLICLGYPFHPPGKPEKERTAHLREIPTQTLILQGTRDPFGTPPEVAGYNLAAAIRIHWLEDGDHSFKPRKKSGRSEEQNLAEAVSTAAAFLHDL